VDPRAGQDVSKEKRLARTDIFCFLSVLLCPDCPGFAFCPYCTTQTFMLQAEFESAIPASDRPLTFALDHSANRIGQEFEPRTIHIMAFLYTDYAISAHY
jgi:hypothetical protein